MFTTLVFYYLSFLNILTIVLLFLACMTITMLGYLVLFIFYNLICFFILYNAKIILFGIILCIAELHVIAALFFFVFCWLNLNTLTFDYLMSLYRLKILRLAFFYILFSSFCVFTCFSSSTQTYLASLFYYYDNFINYFLIYNTGSLSVISTLSFYIYNVYCFELYLINIIFLICVFVFYAFYNSFSAVRAALYYSAVAKYNSRIVQNGVLFIRKQQQANQLSRDAATRCIGKYFAFTNKKTIK